MMIHCLGGHNCTGIYLLIDAIQEKVHSKKDISTAEIENPIATIKATRLSMLRNQEHLALIPQTADFF